MSTLTQSHHVAQALRFLAATNKYIGIGRTAAWDVETAPPAPSVIATGVDTPICYAPLSKACLVVADAGGAITFGGDTYLEVPPEDAYTVGATQVYVEAQLNGAAAPLVTYRQAALFSGLTKAGGAGAGILLPADVTDPGILEVLDNRQPTYRAADTLDVIAHLLQF